MRVTRIGTHETQISAIIFKILKAKLSCLVGKGCQVDKLPSDANHMRCILRDKR